MKALLFPLLISGAAFAAESASYSLTPIATNAGGRRSSSTHYTLDSSTEPGGATASAAYAQRSGYAGALYDVTGLVIDPAPVATVDEGAARSFVGNFTLDDLTLLPVAPVSISWSIVSGPLLSISASGMATARAVYQDAPAIVQGAAAGLTGTAGLLVRNVGSDDFGTFAADGLDDAWQVQYFGEGNALAGPTVDADGDGQNNLFEFRSGHTPTNSLSLLQTRIVARSGGIATIELSSVRVGTRYVFERSTDLVHWTDPLAVEPALPSAPFQQSLPATEPGTFYRVRLDQP